MLQEPLLLILLMLHITTCRITQFSCSSPCSKLHKCCSLCIHCSPVKNPNKWILQPNDHHFLPCAGKAAVAHLQMQLRSLRPPVLQDHGLGSLFMNLPLPSVISSGWDTQHRNVKARHQFNSFHCSSSLHLPRYSLCSHFPAFFLFHNFFFMIFFFCFTTSKTVSWVY